MSTRRTKDPVSARLADSLRATLLDDPEFTAAIAQEEIDRRVAAGELLPAERLQLAPGWILVPLSLVERLDDLRTAVAELMDAHDITDDAVTALLDTEITVRAETPPVGGTEGVSAPAAAAGTGAPAAAGDPEDDERVRRPRGMPGPKEQMDCEECGRPCEIETLTGGETISYAQLSWIRCQRFLCKKHLARMKAHTEAKAS